jgi:hypothetical protein
MPDLREETMKKRAPKGASRKASGSFYIPLGPFFSSFVRLRLKGKDGHNEFYPQGAGWVFVS